MQDEHSLIARAQARDAEAFGRLYEAYFDRIYRYVALKIGSRSEAEDLTQQVFMNALESITSYKVREVPFSAWLYRIAHNQVVDCLRKRSRRPTLELDESLPLPSEEDIAAETELKLETRELIEALKKLTPSQQEVITLRFGAEMPITEVARLLGKTEGAVKAMQHSAVAALRRIMCEPI
ncbi:ECF subfamily RNA polymerase sigma factor, BldN family [Dehalogenimonas alkenigignens]|uniref:RNA polymerase sigma factor n=1 Tax=Dehalogenimonas alkenigignens TaxID=1217799 RepID=A0A0W0GHX4_9CHLR|nr:ECF subfamily RNA polymerase sigma factor, BldN family [Dehalogenimonas alkenigignens]KTB48153.1 RNA polymerase sigma-70 factor, TIGR02952 family [Dehalogenimonas alkenigignens]PVV84392.1 RNA polymerase subunit sigma-70 [Dehalogenimonas alkenigignens]